MAKLGSWRNCQYAALVLLLFVVLNQLFLMRDWGIISPIEDEMEIEGKEVHYNMNNPIAISRTKILEYKVDDNKADDDYKEIDDNDDNDGINRSFDNGLKLTTKMLNAETKEYITCDPNKYKYIQLLLNDLKKYNLKQDGKMVTSEAIDNIFEKKDAIRWFWLRRARMQIIDGELYTNNVEIGKKDEEGYRTGVILYLKRIFKLYGKHIPNTDFLWHYHDKKGSMTDLSEYDWKNLSIVPIFVSDFNEASLPNTRTLYFMPRGYLKYRYFADIAESEGGEGKSKLYNSKNIRRIKDYLEYLELENNKPEALKWENKKINKAVFRGYLNNGFSRRHFFNTLNLADISGIAEEYFDAKFTTEWANTAKDARVEKFSERDKFHANKEKEFEALDGNSLNVEQQFEFRYQVNIDGYGVRDNLMYQMLSGSIILKQLSTLIEFWYYDLIDNKHVIFWENILDLINIVIRVVDSLEVKHRKKSGTLTGFHSWILRNWDYMVQNNMTKYDYKKLNKITQNAKEFVNDYLGKNNMDCFFIHMLEIYNYYFFDSKSLPKTPHHRLTKVT